MTITVTVLHFANYYRASFGRRTSRDEPTWRVERLRHANDPKPLPVPVAVWSGSNTHKNVLAKAYDQMRATLPSAPKKVKSNGTSNSR